MVLFDETPEESTAFACKKDEYHWNFSNLYYWSELELYELRMVSILPQAYYRWLYRLCLWIVEYKPFRFMVNRIIHIIPYHIRFELAWMDVNGEVFQRLQPNICHSIM